MKTRAAIAWAAGKPLEVVDVELDGPRHGEVLVEIRATGICHTDEFTRSGADPEGLFPVIFGHEGAGQEIKTRPFQLVTGRVWKGTAFGGARGRTDVPKIVDWYMDGKINDAFDLMHKGESIRSVVTF